MSIYSLVILSIIGGIAGGGLFYIFYLLAKSVENVKFAINTTNFLAEEIKILKQVTNLWSVEYVVNRNKLGKLAEDVQELKKKNVNHEI